MGLLRSRLLAILTMLAFGAALAFVVAAPVAMAQPCPEMTVPPGHDGPMHGAMPDCGHGPSCILMVALPSGAAPVVSPFGWSFVHYSVAPDDLTGLTVRPDPSPPRSSL